ncbi:MAG: endonuclease domain-containing protein [Leptolyngbya sp. DLM2.Bin15]|nr:MAG: endonuclease domain-containing protein [Leptolyngbya sp. DLM2.Bin15]
MANLRQSDFFLPYNPALNARAREMRLNPTPAERKLWQQCLRGCSHKMLRQRPIGNYIVDFYCAKLRLAIEVDGDSHFTEDGIQYDLERTMILEGYGLQVIRFTNHEVMQQFEAVCQSIDAELKACVSRLQDGA